LDESLLCCPKSSTSRSNLWIRQRSQNCYISAYLLREQLKGAANLRTGNWLVEFQIHPCLFLSEVELSKIGQSLGVMTTHIRLFISFPKWNLLSPRPTTSIALVASRTLSRNPILVRSMSISLSLSSCCKCHNKIASGNCCDNFKRLNPGFPFQRFNKVIPFSQIINEI
jgi:hypothetical protein